MIAVAAPRTLLCRSPSSPAAPASSPALPLHDPRAFSQRRPGPAPSRSLAQPSSSLSFRPTQRGLADPLRALRRPTPAIKSP